MTELRADRGQPSQEPELCDLPGAETAPTRSPINADLVLESDDSVAVTALYEARGWGDGLPLVAPTEARVEAMLAACNANPQPDPDELVAVLPPRLGAATRRVIAVNAVLAGCADGVLPVLVSAVRALATPSFNLRGVNATTHPVAPLLVVHGQAVSEYGFNAGLGCFGPGNRANATVGRALRLILLHVAGARPADGDASTQGQPSKYAYCIAENTAASPWESYPRSCGVDAESSVTLAAGENPHNVHDMESDAPEGILLKVASVMARLGSNNAPVSAAEFFVVLGPEHAATIAAAGWSRRDVQSFLFERARLPANQLQAAFEITQRRPWMNSLRGDDAMPLAEHPDCMRVLVAGGPGKHSCVIPSWGMTSSATMAIAP